MVKEDLLEKVKLMEKYLGPRVNWSMDSWPRHLPDRWIMEYCILLKNKYYKNLKKKRS